MKDKIYIKSASLSNAWHNKEDCCYINEIGGYALKEDCVFSKYHGRWILWCGSVYVVTDDSDRLASEIDKSIFKLGDSYYDINDPIFYDNSSGFYLEDCITYVIFRVTGFFSRKAKLIVNTIINLMR